MASKDMSNVAPSIPAQGEQKDKGACEHLEEASPRAVLASRYTEYERSLFFFETTKIYWRSCLWCLYAMLVVFNFGIDGIIAGYQVSIPKFCEDYGTAVVNQGVSIYVIPATWISIFGAVSQGTSAIGSIIAGYTADKIGRRWATVLSCVISIGGVFAQYYSNGSLGILVAGKCINGIAIGMWVVISSTYVSEVAPFRIRGVLSAMINTVLFSGVFLFTGVTYVVSARPDRSAYMIPFACQWIIPGSILLTFFVWPESPTWLARIGKRKQAINALERLHGSRSTINKEGIMAQIEETLAHELSFRESGQENFGFLECFNKTNRQRTLTTMWVYACQYFSGNTLVIGYQTYFYQLVVGWDAQTSFAVGLGATGFFWGCNILAWCLIAKLRRRILLVYGQFCAAVCLFSVGGASSSNSKHGLYAAVAFMYIWGFFYEISLATVGWVIGSELPALRMRARTQALSNALLNIVSWVQAFIFPYMFNPDVGNLGGHIAFYFGATTFMGFLGTFFMLPETLNRTPIDIDRLYEQKVPIRKFRTTKLDGDGFGFDEKSTVNEASGL